jgi:hypothetical protein
MSLLAATNPQKKNIKINVVSAPLFVDLDMVINFFGKLL